MIYVSAEDRKRSALAKQAARPLARMVDWTPEPCTSIMPPALTGFEYVDRVNIVIAHWHKRLSLAALIRAVAECRSDLLLVEQPHVVDPQANIYMTLLLCRDGEVQVFTASASGSTSLILQFTSSRIPRAATRCGHFWSINAASISDLRCPGRRQRWKGSALGQPRAVGSLSVGGDFA
ncbi:hypothetical protein [Novosphingobium sp. PhB57]|uniref:hypothetical protein n=1 Tax=Novosphingobium sp. PhB57 TaxID=2485107 RepID=UPI0010437D9F|nr:hypothetical protein [Novosphingobium sp. PhB57]